MSVACHFSILNRDDPGNSHRLYIGNDGPLITDHPPVVGDTISLSGKTIDPDDEDQMIRVLGTFTVLLRRWMPASYGSQVWPYGERQSGHEWLELMIEPVEHEMYAPELWARTAGVTS